MAPGSRRTADYISRSAENHCDWPVATERQGLGAAPSTRPPMSHRRNCDTQRSWHHCGRECVSLKKEIHWEIRFSHSIWLRSYSGDGLTRGQGQQDNNCVGLGEVNVLLGEFHRKRIQSSVRGLNWTSQKLIQVKIVSILLIYWQTDAISVGRQRPPSHPPSPSMNEWTLPNS